MQPERLLEKVKLTMSRYGIKHAEPDCYGLLVDQTEDLMKSIISELIGTCRTRLLDDKTKMPQAKPGDTCDVKTVSYVNEEEDPTV